MVDAKILEIRREQDGRYRDVDSKLDRNNNDVRGLERTLTSELGAIRALLYEAKEEFAANKASVSGVAGYKQWLFPTFISVIVAIIEGIHLFLK